MKTITKEWLQEKRACNSGMRWFLAQEEINTAKIMTKLVNEDRAGDALWILENLMSEGQLVKLAIFSAELCIHNFEKEYPEDDRPRKAIEAAKACLSDPCAENKYAAWYAAESARSAAESAAESAESTRSAAESARSAAESAAESAESAWSAWSAAESAESTRSTARSAAWYAAESAWSAARSAAWYAAESAAESAWSAARSAAWYAALKETQIKIINYAIEICEL